ncbi:Pentatricopeptide repeat-containing protein mitochondrial [Spatholobus suberectus]|nr:Pentatricopeptide repeat-containing protein mitochondrial [Spatholobus suberectus]
MLSLRSTSTRRLCHSAADSPLRPILQRLKSESDPDALFQLFQSNATNRLLVENRFAFRDAVSRLAAARRFDHIERLLEHQKTLPHARREGFLVRIITLYGRAGMTAHALRTFHHARARRTVKSFNAALKVLALSRNLHSVLDFLSLVPPRYDIQLDVFSVNIAIKAFCDLGKLQEAYLFMVESENKGIPPDVVTYTTLMNAFYKSKRWEIGNGLWNRMVLKGCVPTLPAFNVRVQFLVTARRAWDANKLMGLMEKLGVEPDEVTFNLVIKGFCVAGYLDMAKRVYSALHGKGGNPNAKIYQTMIHYLCKSRDFDVAYTMCKDSMRKNWFPDVNTICMLLEGLKGSGQIDKGIVIMTLVRKRVPPFASRYLASMQSALSRS